MESRAGRGSSRAWGSYYEPNPSYKPPQRLRLYRSMLEVEMPKPDEAFTDFIPGVPWWLAKSSRSVKMLRTLLKQQELPCVLYERMGALEEVGRSRGLYLVNIQLIRKNVGTKDWDLDLALTDAGIYLEEELAK